MIPCYAFHSRFFLTGASKRNFPYFMYIGTFARVKSLFVDDMSLYMQMLNCSMYGCVVFICWLHTRTLKSILMLSSYIFISDEYSWCLVNIVFVTSMFFSWFPICLVYLKMWQNLWTLILKFHFSIISLMFASSKLWLFSWRGWRHVSWTSFHKAYEMMLFHIAYDFQELNMLMLWLMPLVSWISMFWNIFISYMFPKSFRVFTLIKNILQSMILVWLVVSLTCSLFWNWFNALDTPPWFIPSCTYIGISFWIIWTLTFKVG